VVAALALVACGSSGPSAAPSTTAPAGATSAADIAGVRAAAAPFADFEQVRVTIVSADGRTRTPCLLLARTPAARDRGLMHVTDETLGGHGAMLFAFDADVTGTFWMKGTVLPLSVAFFDRSGHLVSGADMAPCPTQTVTCPTYPASAPYRWAVEAPAGRLGALGLSAADRPRVTVGGACPT
jgi:uncharacterized protein